MEQVLLGIVIFNAFFMPSDFQFDTLEIAQVNLKKNDKTELTYNDQLKISKVCLLVLGDYSQATSWLRYGHGTYLYGQTSESEDGLRKRKQYGGYAGLLGGSKLYGVTHLKIF